MKLEHAPIGEEEIMTFQAGIFFLPTFEQQEGEAATTMFARITEQTKLADELGYTGAWFAEHHFQPHGGLLSAPSIIIAALAQQTRRIRFGLGVIQVPYHHPLSLAEQVTTLDHTCMGRLDVGVGRAFLKCKYDGFGIPMNQSRARFNEGVDIIVQALTHERFAYEGSFYQFPELMLQPQPLQQPHPPLWVAAATTPETFQWAGRQGFHLMVAPLLTTRLEELSEKIELYERARAEAGHSSRGEILVNVHVHVSLSNEQARAEAEAGLNRYVHKTQEAGASAIASFMREGVPSDFARYPELGKRWRRFSYDDSLNTSSVLIGGIETCIEKLQFLQHKLHCTYLAGTFDFGQEQGTILRSMRIFFDKVLPAAS